MRDARVSRRQPPRRRCPPAPARSDHGLSVAYAPRQEIEQLAYAALRDAIAHDPERAHAQLAMLRRCLDTAPGADITAADRAAVAQALADTVPSHH
jgi:hypothetical protein